MTILTVTARGQVTLRKEVLNHLGLKPGDKNSCRFVAGRQGRIDPEKKDRDLSMRFSVR